MTTSTDRTSPVGYERPARDAPGTLYWLEPQANWDGATPLFMVMRATPGTETVMAERCYRTYGVEIVDALRACGAP